MRVCKCESVSRDNWLADWYYSCRPNDVPAAVAGSSHVLALISFIKKDNEPVVVSLHQCACARV